MIDQIYKMPEKEESLPFVSIVMPTFNGEKYIEEALASVLAQDYRPFELVISDNGSTDKTIEMVSTFMAKNEHLRILTLRCEQKGIFSNLNNAIEASSGQLIKILCQDDFFSERSSLTRIVGEISESHSEILFIRHNHGSDSPSDLVRVEQDALPRIIRPPDSSLYFYLFGCIPGNLSNVTMKREIIGRVGMLPTEYPYAGDFAYWSRAGTIGAWAVSSSRVVNVRNHAEQASFTLNKNAELVEQIVSITNGLFDEIVEAYHPNRRNMLLLKMAGLIHYGTMNVDRATKDLVKSGSLRNLRSTVLALRQARYWLGVLPMAAVQFLSIGGRVLRPSFCKAVLRAFS